MQRKIFLPMPKEQKSKPPEPAAPEIDVADKIIPLVVPEKWNIPVTKIVAAENILVLSPDNTPTTGNKDAAPAIVVESVLDIPTTPSVGSIPVDLPKDESTVVIPPVDPVKPPETPPEPIKNRGRGRPLGAPNKPKAPDFSDITQGSGTVDHAAMAAVVFDMSTSAAVVAIGEEWKPSNSAEREMVVSAIAAYFKSKDVKDVPPALMLSFVVLAYSLPRLTKPNTSNKLKLAWQWVKVKLLTKRVKP